jgi:RNA polymerase sigma factor (sigma-70 family)
MIYRYKSLKGAAIEVEIAEEWGEILIELDNEEQRSNDRNIGANREYRDKNTGKRRKVGRNRQLSEFEFLEGALFSDNADILADIIEKECKTEKQIFLRAAIAELQPQQRELLDKIFIHKQKAAEIARADGVSEAAIHGRLKKIYNKLKKHLPDGVKF